MHNHDIQLYSRKQFSATGGEVTGKQHGAHAKLGLPKPCRLLSPALQKPLHSMATHFVTFNDVLRHIITCRGKCMRNTTY